MNVLDRTCGSVRHVVCKQLETRWWSKDVALIKVFGSFKNSQSAMYVDVLLALEEIEESKVSPEIRAKCRSYEEALLQCETLMTAFIYLRILETTTPLSKYLQSTGMDILKAHQMVTTTINQLTNVQRDMQGVKNSVASFHYVGKRKTPEKISRKQHNNCRKLPQRG